MNEVERKKALTLIYRHTSRDYKGHLNGEKSILVLRTGGTTLVPLTALTDEEIARDLPHAQKCEEKRLAKKVSAKKRPDSEPHCSEELPPGWAICEARGDYD
jgi:hypothetical protein